MPQGALPFPEILLTEFAVSQSMRVLINGEPLSVLANTTVADVLKRLDYGARRLAVELNGEIVPRSQHGQKQVCDGDRLEIVTAVGGG